MGESAVAVRFLGSARPGPSLRARDQGGFKNA